jgi:hypothetical protein
VYVASFPQISALARLIPPTNTVQVTSTLPFYDTFFTTKLHGGTVYVCATKHHGGTLRHRHKHLPLHTASTNTYIYHSNIFGLCTPFFGPLPHFAHNQQTPHFLLPIPIFSNFSLHYQPPRGHCRSLRLRYQTPRGPLPRFAHHQHTPLILLNIPPFFPFVSTFFILPSSGWNQRA